VNGPTKTATAASLDHLYWHFLDLQRHLDATAAEREKANKESRWLKDHFQRELSFSDSDFAIIRVTAAKVDEEGSRLDAQARLVLKQDRASRAAGIVPTGTIPQLQLLSRDRKDMLKVQIGLMNDQLGPAKAKALQSYLTDHFASNIQIMARPSGKATPSPQQGGK
jgi:hypothetical protein